MKLVVKLYFVFLLQARKCNFSAHIQTTCKGSHIAALYLYDATAVTAHHILKLTRVDEVARSEHLKAFLVVMYYVKYFLKMTKRD